MFKRFTTDTRAIVTGAEREAMTLGAPTIEAEHLLLAYTASSKQALDAAGLDHDTLVGAIDDAFRLSLEAAGVSEDLAAAPATTATKKPRFGASSKAALTRAVKVASESGERRIEPRHLALGVLEAKRGIVPQALRAAGIEQRELQDLLCLSGDLTSAPVRE